VTDLPLITGHRFDLGGVGSVPLSLRVPSDFRRAPFVLFKYLLLSSPLRGRQPDVMERDREQADLPTEQPPPGEDPRFPPADAYPRRPRDPAGPSPEGPQRALGVSRQEVSVLPAEHRLRSSSDFTSVTRQGHRARSGGLVVYVVTDESSGPGRVGLVVGKSVGGSVVRHRVSRRLRAQLSERLGVLPPGSRVVVRALPDAAGETSVELGRDLDKAFGRLLAGAR
jgi:ribonuclease P protein component